MIVVLECCFLICFSNSRKRLGYCLYSFSRRCIFLTCLSKSSYVCLSVGGTISRRHHLKTTKQFTKTNAKFLVEKYIDEWIVATITVGQDQSHIISKTTQINCSVSQETR